MTIDRQKHWQFLEDELKAETEDFNKKFLTTAISLLQHSEEMFVAQFISFKDGEMIMRFPNTRALPRKGDFFVCMALPPQLQDYHNWGDKTYRDLYKERYMSTECVCVWIAPAEDKRFSLVGFSRVSLEFAAYIKGYAGMVLTFAPQRPPIDYMLNLQRVVEDRCSQGVSDILDACYQPNGWEPILIKQDNVSDFVLRQLELTDTMILEGPPGTGKTHMIAELCAKLCAQGKSVIVTALTNRALIEVAEKAAVEPLLNAHKVLKTNVTIDEQKEIGKLEPIKSIVPMPSCIVLSTYYITSGFAAEISIEQPFDYVIMDEASQAILAMFAASRKIGKKTLWVGDSHQLAPIVALNGDRIKLCGYRPLIPGLEVLAESSSHPIYQLTKTYRLSERAANYTGIFYNGTLKTDKTKTFSDIPSMSRILSPDGGPTLVLTDMPPGDTSPEFAITLATYIVARILKDCESKEIAVLTCMRKTTRSLTKTIVQHIGARKNVLIDTVAKVQGLTTDVTLFFVPDYSLIRTIEPHLFNVATSRAKEHTIIVADKYILDYPTIDSKVRMYLQRLKDDRCVYIPDPTRNTKNTASREDLLDGIGSLLLP